MAALFENRFRFGIDQATEAKLNIRAGARRCWRCKARTQVVTELTARVGPYELEGGIRNIGSELAERIHDILKQRTNINTVLDRQSATLGRSYVNNACRKCGNLMGIIGLDWFAPGEEETVASLDWELDAEDMNRLAEETQRWAVWETKPKAESEEGNLDETACVPYSTTEEAVS